MPTFRRPEQLARTLGALAEQTKVLDHLVVVDNGGDVESALGADLSRYGAASEVTVLRPGSNLGPAGALAISLEHARARTGPESWVVSLDDDDPPGFPDLFERLWDTAHALVTTDPRCGAVGLGGSRFDPRRVRLSRLDNDELTGDPVRVTVISGNHLPMVRVAALHEVGSYQSELFFGLDDFEFFLRMNELGWHAYCDSALLQRHRQARGRTGQPSVPSTRLGQADWRRYYSVRNRVHIARRFAGPVATARLVGELLGKVVVNVAREPRVASSHLRLTTRACLEGLQGRLGATWPPELTNDGRLPSHDRRPNRSPGGEP